MEKITRILAIVIIISNFQQIASTQTIIPGGDVSGNWNMNGSPYLITDDIIIPDDSTLSIEAGVLVEFQGHFALYVMGSLLALGNQTDTIVFSVNDTTGFSNQDTTLGGWYGIRFVDTPSGNDSSKIKFCRIQYGKAIADVWHLNAGGGICIINFSKVKISNSLITNNIAGGPYTDVPSGGGIHLAWSDVVIENNTFSHNRARSGGAIQMHESFPQFSGNIFIGNIAENGGGISANGQEPLSFNGDQFVNNIAYNNGGGIMCWEPGNWSFNNVLFSGNKSSWGAGLGVVTGSISLSHCSFILNHAEGIGGGIAADFSSLIIDNTDFLNDTCDGISGAIHNWFCDTEISNCTFLNNNAVLGGGIYSDYSEVKINNSTFGSNTAESGGALRFWGSDLITNGVLFSGNHAFYEGGALDYIADTGTLEKKYKLDLLNSTFIDNSADFRCGAARIEQFNSDTSLIQLKIDNCEFTGNSAERIGANRIIGNIFNITISNTLFQENSSTLWTGCTSIGSGASGQIFNSLFFDNQAGAGGTGALGLSNGSHVDILNSTFAANSATGGGGLQLRLGASANVINSIFWGNSPGQAIVNSINDTTPCSLFVDYCDFQNGLDSLQVIDSISTIYWGDGNIAEQPMFSDILNENFELNESSPCLGKGIDSILVNDIWLYAPEFDMFSTPRPSPTGSLPDMGHLESLLSGSQGINKQHQNNNSLTSNYPNPFSLSTTIEFVLTESCSSSFTIYDFKGNLIEVILNNKLSAGKHFVIWHASELCNGIYYYEFMAGDYVERKKILLIR